MSLWRHFASINLPSNIINPKVPIFEVPRNRTKPFFFAWASTMAFGLVLQPWPLCQPTHNPGRSSAGLLASMPNYAGHCGAGPSTAALCSQQRGFCPCVQGTAALVPLPHCPTTLISVCSPRTSRTSVLQCQGLALQHCHC